MFLSWCSTEQLQDSCLSAQPLQAAVSESRHARCPIVPRILGSNLEVRAGVSCPEDQSVPFRSCIRDGTRHKLSSWM